MFGGIFVAIFGLMFYLLVLVPAPNPQSNPIPIPRPPLPNPPVLTHEVMIDLTSEPSNADIFLDETRLGLTSQRITLKKRDEGYRLEIRKDGYQSFQRVIRVRHGAQKPVPLHVKLNAIPQAAYLTVKPRARLRILLNGQDLKRYTLDRHTLPAGTHTLTLVNKKKRRWTLQIELKPGEHKTIRPTYR